MGDSLFFLPPKGKGVNSVDRVEAGTNKTDLAEPSFGDFMQVVEKEIGGPTAATLKEAEIEAARKSGLDETLTDDEKAALEARQKEEADRVAATTTEAEAKAKAEADALAEQKAKDDAEAKAKNEAATAFVLSDALKAEFPEVKDPTEFVTAVEAKLEKMREEISDADLISTMVLEIQEKEPAMIDVLKDIRKGIPAYEAVAKHLSVPETGIPDPQEDPEGYRAFVQKDTERRANAKIAQEKLDSEKAAAAERTTFINTQVTTQREALQRAHNLTNEQLVDLEVKVNEMLMGDPKTGKLPTDLYERLYKLVNYDEHVKQAAEEKKKAEAKALIDGKAKGIEEAARRKKGDGLPDARSAGKPASVLTPEVAFLTSMVNSGNRVL